MKTTKIMAIVAVLVFGMMLGAGAAQAGVITVTSTEQTNAGLNYGHGTVASVGDGTGLSGDPPVHDTDWLGASMWHATSTTAPNKGYATFIFTFDSNQTGGKFHLWNYNRPGYANYSGFKTADIHTSALTSGDGDWVAQGSWAFLGATGAAGYAGQEFTLTSYWTNVRRVKIAGTSSYTEDGGWGTPDSGLSEVQFHTAPPVPVPEPAGLGLIGLALLAVRRKRS